MSLCSHFLDWRWIMSILLINKNTFTFSFFYFNANSLTIYLWLCKQTSFWLNSTFILTFKLSLMLLFIHSFLWRVWCFIYFKYFDEICDILRLFYTHCFWIWLDTFRWHHMIVVVDLFVSLAFFYVMLNMWLAWWLNVIAAINIRNWLRKVVFC